MTSQEEQLIKSDKSDKIVILRPCSASRNFVCECKQNCMCAIEIILFNNPPSKFQLDPPYATSNIISYVLISKFYADQGSSSCLQASKTSIPTCLTELFFAGLLGMLMWPCLNFDNPCRRRIV